MAIVKIVDEDRVISGEEDVRQYLAGVGIEYERWELSPEIDKDSSSEAVLAAYAEQVERVKRAGGYAKVDVVNVKFVNPGHQRHGLKIQRRALARRRRSPTKNFVVPVVANELRPVHARVGKQHVLDKTDGHDRALYVQKNRARRYFKAG